MQPEAQPYQCHDRHFKHFDQACKPGLVVLVGQLSGRGREQEERQNENARRQVHQQRRLQAGPLGCLERQQHDQGILEQVVVEGPQKLGDEERAEMARLEQ